MASTRLKGTLNKWFDNKGFGFITEAKGSSDIFIHITAFSDGIPRRPQVGDVVFYYKTTDKSGKTKAVDAIIEGLEPVVTKQRTRPKPTGRYEGTKSGLTSLLLCLVVTIGALTSAYLGFMPKTDRSAPPPETGVSLTESPQTRQSPQFNCSGKTRCNQMTSCAEATFYLRNCPNTQIDGDGDGIPCERQFCDN